MGTVEQTPIIDECAFKSAIVYESWIEDKFVSNSSTAANLFLVYFQVIRARNVEAV